MGAKAPPRSQVAKSAYLFKGERVEGLKERTVFDGLGNKALAKGVIEQAKLR